MQLQTLQYRFTIGPLMINQVGTQEINHRGRGTEIASQKGRKLVKTLRLTKTPTKGIASKERLFTQGEGRQRDTGATHLGRAGTPHGREAHKAGSAGPETRQEVSINIKREVHETMKHENSKGNLTRGTKTRRCLT